MEMTVKQIRDILSASIGKRLQITFADDAIQCVDINAVDDEGFLHSGPDGIEQQFWWTRLEDIKSINSN